MSAAVRGVAASAMLGVVTTLARIDTGLREAMIRTVALREGLLDRPERAARRHCEGSRAAKAYPCTTSLTWRREGANSDLCSDLARDGDADGAVWNVRRHYVIETRCSVSFASLVFPLPLLGTHIIR